MERLKLYGGLTANRLAKRLAPPLPVGHPHRGHQPPRGKGGVRSDRSHHNVRPRPPTVLIASFGLAGLELHRLSDPAGSLFQVRR